MPTNVREAIRWLDQNLEKTFLITAFAACAGIVAVEVVRRFVFSLQAPWSTTIPSYLFLWLTWIGCAYCVRIRTHLCFGEIRDRLPPFWQFVLIQSDYVLYLVFGLIVIYWSYDLTALHYNIESIVPGTDDVPSWIFYSATPLGWGLLLFRVAQNVIDDVRDFRAGRPPQVRGSLAITD